MNYVQALEGGMVRHAEKRFPVGESTVTAKTITGEYVLTLVIGGVKLDGQLQSDGCSSLAQAADAWKAEFDLLYPPGTGGVLYWRAKPRLERTDNGGWQVYSRLLVSSAPRL